MKNILKIAIMMLLIVGIAYALAAALKAFGIEEGWPTRIVPFITMIAITLIFTRIDKAAFVELGLGFSRESMPVILVLLCSSGIPLFAGLLLDGSIAFKKPFDISLFGFIPYYVLVAFSEEFLYRGYMGRVLEKNSNIVKASVSALAFSGFHFISPEFNVINFILLFIFGIIFMYMYILAGNLWPLIVFHFSWDVLSEYIASYQNVLLCLAGLLITLVVLWIVRKRRFRAV